MSDTAKDWRMVADLLAANADRLPSPMRAREIVDECLVEADRLDHEEAEEAFVEAVAQVSLEGEREHWRSVGVLNQPLPLDDMTGDHQAAVRSGARAVIAHLQPIAEWLVAEQARRARDSFEWRQRISRALGVTPGRFNHTLEEAVAAIEMLRRPTPGGMVLTADEVECLRTLIDLADPNFGMTRAAAARLGARFATAKETTDE